MFYVKRICGNENVNFPDTAFESQVINTDIVAHLPAVESVVKAADEVLLNSEPEEARNIQSKVDSIQKRYDIIDDVTEKHGEDLLLLGRKLADFEKEVDHLEDFVIPGLETLEARDLMRMDMNQLGKKLNVRAVSLFVCFIWLLRKY